MHDQKLEESRYRDFETIRIDWNEHYEKLGQTEFVTQNESDHRRIGA